MIEDPPWPRSPPARRCPRAPRDRAPSAIGAPGARRRRRCPSAMPAAGAARRASAEPVAAGRTRASSLVVERAGRRRRSVGARRPPARPALRRVSAGRLAARCVADVARAPRARALRDVEPDADRHPGRRRALPARLAQDPAELPLAQHEIVRPLEANRPRRRAAPAPPPPPGRRGGSAARAPPSAAGASTLSQSPPARRGPASARATHAPTPGPPPRPRCPPGAPACASSCSASMVEPDAREADDRGRAGHRSEQQEKTPEGDPVPGEGREAVAGDVAQERLDHDDRRDERHQEADARRPARRPR